MTASLKKTTARLALIYCVVAHFSVNPALCQEPGPPILDLKHPHVPNRILATFDDASFHSELSALSPALLHVRPVSSLSSDWIIEVQPHQTGSEIDLNSLAKLAVSAGAKHVEPDYLLSVLKDPNDPAYFDRTTWWFNNVGQNGGVTDADIDAREAWDIQDSASDVIIAVIDTGARLTHEDLKDNFWNNPGEIPGNQLDDDQNGYIDDFHGINAINNDGNPVDDHGHGTHLAGIIAAKGNNAKGTVGVIWKGQIMPLKFMASNGSGSVSDAIQCIDYAINKSAQIINASWGNVGQSFFLERAIRRTRDNGIVFVTAAGNSSQDIEETPNFPASYTFSNIISVCATTERDTLVSFSNYGNLSVDLGAPGASIYSTYFRNDADYHEISGSSMAAALVSGSVAALIQKYPDAGYEKWIEAILQSVDSLPALEEKTVSGGRLNLNGALRFLQTNEDLVPAHLQWLEGNRQIRITGSSSTLYAVESTEDGKNWIFHQAVLTDFDGIALIPMSSTQSSSKWYRAITVE